MSDTDSRGVNGDANDMDNICRDFLRNVCRRGKRCKYRHPEPSESKEMGRKTELVFCHDFQNKECRRINCKFIHCTRSEEEYYHMTGDMPQHLQESLGGGVGTDSSDIPICKDYQKGDCRRGGRCKFRHISPSEYEMEMGRDVSGGASQQLSSHGGAGGGGGGSSGRQPSLVAPPPLPSDYYILEEENAFLRRRVEELKKQVSDLTAANEFLLDQNAQLRLGKQTAVTPMPQSMNPNSIAPVVPPVQVSSGQMAQMTQLPVADLAVAVPQELAAAAAPQTITPIVPVSMAPVSIAPVSIAQAIPAASLVQSIPNPLVSYPIMTQGMRPTLTPSSLTH
ncbi:hypothetical protein CHUAL_013267 [Chamberlinius hualienensis]